ncbi:hypothetical protein D3C71_1863480 [compost metagenome]
MLENAPGEQHQCTVLDAQHVAGPLVLQPATGLAQGRGLAIEGEQNAVGQVVDPGHGQYHPLTYRLVAAVVMGKRVCEVVAEAVLLLEVFEQLDVAQQEVVDLFVENVTEFVAHLYSLSSAQVSK